MSALSDDAGRLIEAVNCLKLNAGPSPSVLHPLGFTFTCRCGSVRVRPYQISGLVLNAASPAAQQRGLVLALQEDLRSLGYISGGLDGTFGAQTARGLAAVSYDLLKNNGTSSGGDGPAPVAITAYNKGRVQTIQQELNQALAGCIADLISDAKVPKLPQASDPAVENARAISLVKGLIQPKAPASFMLAMFVQESANQHFKVPNSKDADSFITIDLDHNDPKSDIHITSRGYGLGQATLFHHPPRPDEIASLMLDPAANVRAAFTELRAKFDGFVFGTPHSADDRVAEHPALRLRLCRYAAQDPKYFNDCQTCAKTAGTTFIEQGVPVFAGSSLLYEPDQYYPSANYGNVPQRANFLCDWPYAARRYNGDGLNSYHYQTRVLLNLAHP